MDVNFEIYSGSRKKKIKKDKKKTFEIAESTTDKRARAIYQPA